MSLEVSLFGANNDWKLINEKQIEMVDDQVTKSLN